MYFVYLLESQSDHGWYIGFTNDVDRRFLEHLDHKNVSTKNRGPFKLIYYEAYINKADALGRSKFLKKRCRSSVLTETAITLFSGRSDRSWLKTHSLALHVVSHQIVLEVSLGYAQQ